MPNNYWEPFNYTSYSFGKLSKFQLQLFQFSRSLNFDAESRCGANWSVKIYDKQGVVIHQRAIYINCNMSKLSRNNIQVCIMHFKSIINTPTKRGSIIFMNWQQKIRIFSLVPMQVPHIGQIFQGLVDKISIQVSKICFQKVHKTRATLERR